MNPTQDAGMEWKEAALCQYVSPDIFFPEKHQNARAAKRVCAQCPVRDPCREYALAHSEVIGVWGGLSERDRAVMRRAAAQAQHLPHVRVG